MSVNVKNILVLLDEKYKDLNPTEPTQEEKLIAENFSEILEAHKLDQVEIQESLEYDECVCIFHF